MTLPTPSVRWLLIAAVLSFLPMLNLYYIGEEAIFPITSMEMAQHGQWLKQYLYGSDVRHNPLFNWLIMPVSSLVGWAHVLVVARGLTISATLLTAGTLFWLCNRLFADRGFAAFASLIYLTFTDVMMYHGWLAYVDPLFAMFIFAAIAFLWVGSAESRPSLLWLAALALTCAFLSKAFTAYVFYGAAFVVLGFKQHYRQVLFRATSLLPHAAMLLAPLLWFYMIPGGSHQSGRMFEEILAKLALPNLREYLMHLLMYPLEAWSGLLPASGLVVYFLLRGRVVFDPSRVKSFHVALWIAGLNFLPYWMAPRGGMRYLIPIYPLLALIAAWLIWQAGESARLTTRRWVAAAIVLCFGLGLFIYPYYQHKFRGENYASAAADIVTIAGEQALYVTDSSATGLNVTAYINQRRYPKQALQLPPSQWGQGFVLSRTTDPQLGKEYKLYQLLGDQLYLLCRGSACAQP